MKLIQIPDHDVNIMASDIKTVRLCNPNSQDYGIDILSVDGNSKTYWFKGNDKEIAQQILTKFIFDFNNL